MNHCVERFVHRVAEQEAELPPAIDDVEQSAGCGAEPSGFAGHSDLELRGFLHSGSLAGGADHGEIRGPEFDHSVAWQIKEHSSVDQIDCAARVRQD